jgi:hypothetical protein
MTRAPWVAHFGFTRTPFSKARGTGIGARHWNDEGLRGGAAWRQGANGSAYFGRILTMHS